MSTNSLELPLSLVKDAAGALDATWVGRLAAQFGLRGFIETGTYLGQSLENVCGLFERAVSIELSPQLHEAAAQKFANRSGVRLLLGDSAQMMDAACSACEGIPTLYWLDAHWSAGNTARGSENTPILTELSIIARRASCDDVLLIDDMRYFRSIPAGFATHEANEGYPVIAEVLQRLAGFPGGGFDAVLSGDVLICMSRERMKRLHMSRVLQATTALRTDEALTARARRRYELWVAKAQGTERDVLLELPQHYSHSLQFGIGGEFCYWRALVREAERDYEAALADLELARRCGVHVPSRPWEGPALSARVRRAFAWLVRLGRMPDAVNALSQPQRGSNSSTGVRS